jgi:hypothetical protein
MNSPALHSTSSAVASGKGPAGVGRPQRESRGISPRGYKRIGYAHLGFEHGIHDVVGDYCLPAKCKGDVQMVQDVIAQKKPWGEKLPDALWASDAPFEGVNQFLRSLSGRQALGDLSIRPVETSPVLQDRRGQ